MIKRVQLIIVCSLFLSLNSFSQSLLNTLNAYNTSFPQEKVYVHFDRASYSGGETIWFKAYLYSKDLPSPISTNFYVELLDSKGKLISQAVFPVFESSAAGGLELPEHIAGEAVLVRAYTTWMLNYDSSYLYTKVLNISSKASTQARVAKNTVLRFFPEGGDLVQEFESVIAFKATDENGLPVQVSGTIKDGTGKVIVPFKTVHDGMGKVKIEVAPNTAYYAEWKGEDGQLKRTDLPIAQKVGVLMEVHPEERSISYLLKRSDGLPPAMKHLHLLGIMHQQVVYRATVDMEQTIFTSGAIKADSLTSGVMQLTLFDSEWRPLSERLVFVNKNNYSFDASVHSIDKNLNKRGRNVLEIEVPDTLRTNLSVSITDGDLGAGENESIVSEFILQSDLRGYIHDAAYYFSNNTDSVREHADLLMLTNGWRRYNWEALSTGQVPKVSYPKDHYITLSGNVFGVEPQALATQQQVNLIVQQKTGAPKVLAATIDRSGRFALGNQLFFDTATVYYSFNKNPRLNHTASVSFTPPFKSAKLGMDSSILTMAQAFRATDNRSHFFQQKREEVLPELNRNMKVMEEVVVRGKSKSKEQEFEEKVVTGVFQSNNSHNFVVQDDPGAQSSLNVLEYLRGRVAGLSVIPSGIDYEVKRRGSKTDMFLDEMHVEAEEISAIPMSEIAYIKVIDPPFLGTHGNGAGGAIVVYTRRGGGQTGAGKGLEKGKIVGYTPIKEFYSPDYAQTNNPLATVEDVRPTLFWKPYVLTDKDNHRVRVEFYNNDVSKTLRVVVQGMNENGKLVSIEQVIK